MSLIARPIKSIPLLHLEASQFCLEKSNMDTLRLLPAEYPSPSTEQLRQERSLYSERWSWSFIETKHHTVFPSCGSRQVATWGMGTTPGAVSSCFPSGQGALSLLSQICSPAAHAWGNKDGLSPQVKLCVSANWCLLLLSQYNTVGWKHTFPYLLYYFETCATISFGLLKQKTGIWHCYSPLSSLQLLMKSAFLVLSWQ